MSGASDPGADRRIVTVDFAGAGGAVELPPGRWRIEVDAGDHTAAWSGAGSYDLGPGSAAILAPG